MSIDHRKYSLPISKLRGVPLQLRMALKARKITNCGQLLTAADEPSKRARLVRVTGADAATLDLIVWRADMSRVNGVGSVFGLMLEELGVFGVEALAKQDPEALHRKLRDYNTEVRLARRSPTPEEVEDWIAQARALKVIVQA